MANVPISAFTVGANTTGIGASGYSLTGSAANSYIDLAGTWNTSGTPTAIKLNITDTASNAASLLMDLQVGGSSRLNLRKDGVLTIKAGLTSTDHGPVLDANGLVIAATRALQWGGSQDRQLFSDAASVIAQRSGTAAQTFRVYNTFTDASNYERGKIEWASNVLRIGTEKAGTGTARALELQTDGTTRLTIATDGKATFADRVTIATAAALAWTSRAFIDAPADGVVALRNSGYSDFGRLQFGGTTNSFPAIKRSTTSLQAVLADDTGFTNIQGKITTDTAYTAGAPTPAGYLVLYDSTGTAYKVPAEAV